MEHYNFTTNYFRYVNYIDLTAEEHQIIWQGRNHPDIRKWMAQTKGFSFEEHMNYVMSLKNRQDRIYWAVFQDNCIIGTKCLNPYDEQKKEGEMGTFLLPSYIGKGFGWKIGRDFIDYLLGKKLQRIHIRTKIENTRDQALNLKLGFKEYFRDEDFVYMEIRNNSNQ